MGEALMTHATNSAEETREVGRGFASRLKPGDVVLLSGDLGAGKTQFVQGVAAGLGVAETPISPTFNIVLSYGSGRMPLHHFDLYRLDSPQQLEDIGIAEYLESGGVCLVEWAEKFPHAFEPAYRVNIAKTGDSEREIRIEGEMKNAVSVPKGGILLARSAGPLPMREGMTLLRALPHPQIPVLLNGKAPLLLPARRAGRRAAGRRAKNALRARRRLSRLASRTRAQVRAMPGKRPGIRGRAKVRVEEARAAMPGSCLRWIQQTRWLRSA